MFSKISLKVAVLVNLALLLVMAIGTYAIIRQQGQSLEEQLLQRGKIESVVGAKLIGKVLEEAIDNGVFNLNEAFDTSYQVIPGFEPEKYHTKYDSYLDKAILAMQDEFLKDEAVVYAVAVDSNGYLPTHNSRYQQPITGEQQRDLLGNRTKRIFNDPIGLNAAQNTKPAFLQVYHRDTGETIWDISSPIQVKGKHWGGFRIGFSLQETEAQKAQLKKTLLTTMLGILLASLLLVFVVVSRALRPLTQLTEAAGDLADGKVEERIEVRGKDELAGLADALERLRVSLKAAMARLNRK